MAQSPEPERLVWLLCSSPAETGSAELNRIYQRHGGAIQALSVELKAYVCRFLTARALSSGAAVYEPGHLPLEGGVFVRDVPGSPARRDGVALPQPAAAGALSPGFTPESSVVANILLSTTGLGLTRLKRLIDHPGDAPSLSSVSSGRAGEDSADNPGARQAVDMMAVLSLLPAPMAAHVIHHIRAEAAALVSEGSWSWPLKIYCDFDDTVMPRLFDRSFPAGGVYAGYVPFVRALRGELECGPPAVAAVATPSGRADLVVVDPSPGVPIPPSLPEAERDAGRVARPSVSREPARAAADPPGIVHLRTGFGARKHLTVASDLVLGATTGRGTGSIRRMPLPSASGSPGRAVYASVSGNGVPLAEGGARGPRADLIFLSARPAFMRGATLEAARVAGLSHAAVLCGTIAGALNHTRIAGRKLRNYLLHHALFPEFRVLFVGDSGQADIRFAHQMLAAHVAMFGEEVKPGEQAEAAEAIAPSTPAVVPAPLPGADLSSAEAEAEDGGQGGDVDGAASASAALVIVREVAAVAGDAAAIVRPPPPLALIHDICGADQQPITSMLQRARLRALGVHVFDSYVEAALVAYNSGMLGSEELTGVVDGTTADLAAVRFGPGNEAQRVLRIHEFTKAIRSLDTRWRL